ncbi:MAG TPA: phosphatase PAP2 family protein [Thermoanaerobaculia bacterium]|jgi:membrane-associated phospholipid phosphatase|nr:phosphatase PAP2 family protein [Thermoanaerobaculia bacterium]
MSEASLAPSRGLIRREWDVAAASLARPYRVTVPMVLMMLLVPCYIFIGDGMSGRPTHTPAISWDLAIPVRPAWALVYGCLYLFLIVLPVLVVRQEELIRRTVLAYLFVWITAYVFFVFYPTSAPRPAELAGDGFAAWGLRFLYGADPPYNCFPSLHVAHSFVSALACRRVNRRVGDAAMACASLVGLSTLFTKQHYVADVAAGVLLAGAAWAIFLRSYAREAPDADRRAAPALATLVLAAIAVALLGFWIAYRAGAGAGA